MSGNLENYGGIKGYEYGSEREEGEGEMWYLKGKDIARGFKAATPLFFQFFLPTLSFSSLLSFHFYPILIIQRGKDANTNAQTHYNRSSAALEPYNLTIYLEQAEV